MIKVYKKKIVVFTPKLKITLVYRFENGPDGEKWHHWESVGSHSVCANGNIFTRPQCLKEVLPWVKEWITQKHCHPHEGIVSPDKDWTVCKKCNVSLSYKGQEFNNG